jgi:transcriptional regulator with XRE-family HTH domain
LMITGAPPGGWIRTMRESRGLSLRRLGARVGVAGNSIHVSERREMEGGISLYQLARLAAALDCELRYTFLPRPAGRATPKARRITTRGDA